MGIELTKKTNKINFSGELLRGEPGGYYIPSVDDNGVLTWTPTVETMPDISAANIKGKDGSTPFGEMIPIMQIRTMAEYQNVCLNSPKGEIIYFINVGNSTILTPQGVMTNGVVFEAICDGTPNPMEVYKIAETNSGYPSTNKVLYVVEKNPSGEISFSIISDGATGKDGAPGRDGANGKDGKDGANGKDGSNGADGKNGSDGVSVSKVEVDSNNHLQVTLSNGTTQDAGAITVSGSSGGSNGYELINKFIATKADEQKEIKGFAFSTDINGNPFELTSICAYAYIPAASAGTWEIDLKNADGAIKAIVKRNDMVATGARWIKTEIDLKGYWTGSMVSNSGETSTNAVYEGFHRNNVSIKAYYINLTSNVILPEGSTIEVYGVRA